MNANTPPKGTDDAEWALREGSVSNRWQKWLSESVSPWDGEPPWRLLAAKLAIDRARARHTETEAEAGLVFDEFIMVPEIDLWNVRRDARYENDGIGLEFDRIRRMSENPAIPARKCFIEYVGVYARKEGAAPAQIEEPRRAPQRGYRDEVKAWMQRKGIRSVKAAGRLAMSESTLKSIMTSTGKVRHGEDALKRVLAEIRVNP